jgi:hypothetical protein
MSGSVARLCLKSNIKMLVIINYNSICLMCCMGGIFCHRPLSAILKKKIGKAKEEIRNLNGFEYMYLSDLKEPYFW